MLLSNDECCIVLSNATPGDYEELVELDELFYRTHLLKQWMRSMRRADICDSKNIPGHYQFKYVKIK